jgi:hypothetical protein
VNAPFCPAKGALDNICTHIDSVDLAGADGLLITAKAIKAGACNGSNCAASAQLDLSVSDTEAPLPITLPNTGTIDAVTTNPIDPGPDQGYTVKATTSCLGAQQAIRISMSGTDGFSSSTSCAAGVNSCELFVPGGAEGVVDTITVTGGTTLSRNFQRVF